MMIQASGTLSAIAQAFGGKSVRAMAAFRRSLGGDGATAGDSGEMGGLRSKIRDLVASGDA
jgi:hypothetical protein